MGTTKHLKKYSFKDSGLGTKHTTRPVSVKLPPEIDEIVRSLPNRSEFIRNAIAKELEKEGLLPKAG